MNALNGHTDKNKKETNNNVDLQQKNTDYDENI